MKIHKFLLLALLLLTSCEGFKDTDPALFAAPEVTVGKAVVSDKSIAVELSGAISAIDCKAVKECGFYVAKDASLTSKTTVAVAVKEQFSINFTSDEFGTKYYYQAFISNGKYVINSETQSFDIKPFEYYVSVGKPELVGTERTVAKLKASVQWAEGLNLDETGLQYSRNEDFSSASEASQNTGFNTITQDIELEQGVEYYVRAYAKKGSNVEYGEAITVTVYSLPEVRTSSTVIDVTPTSATCGGEVTSDGGAQVTEYGVVYGTSQNPTIETATKKAVGKGTGSFSATLTGLTTGSTYYVRAYATNFQGTAYGEEVSFTTAKSVTGISLDKTSISLEKGASQTLIATITPSDAYDKAVTWSTSNSSVATVNSSGTVKAIDAGSAIITAITQDGWYKAYCYITVTGTRYITFETTSGENSIKYANNGVNTVSLQYSYDGCQWNTWDRNTFLSFSNTTKLYVRGDNPNGFSKSVVNYSHFSFSSSNTVRCIGSIMNLLSYVNNVQISDYCFYHLFYNCSCLTESPELPATSLEEFCYDGMFSGCTALKTAPQLPATSLAQSCYANMFNGCTALTSAPQLPATSLAQSCYANMFSGCTSLVNAPQLPATYLAEYCYSGMFNKCTALKSAPNLPATSLADFCYVDMFSGCTALKSAPQLPATSLALACYSSMFSGCTALTSAPQLPATSLAQSCYANMFSGCTSLVNTPQLTATYLAKYCYGAMFYGCKSLVTAPKILALSLAVGCFEEMFSGCSSLISAPALPATELSPSCYKGMFSRCTSLVNAPQLPATKMIDSCYSSMFLGCTSLVKAPQLPATSLANKCYSGMFSNCTSLTSAPELPATSLTYDCYNSMFSGCTSLSYVKAMFMVKTAGYITNWLSGVNPTGTFVKNRNATWSNDGVVPTGWTIEYADE